MSYPPKDTTPIRPRPQYHYFYGSTDNQASDTPESSVAGTDADPLLGESLVPTDNEGETPTNSAQDLRQLFITTTNGHARFSHAYLLDTPSPQTENERRSSRSPCPKSIWIICGEHFIKLRGNHRVGQVTRALVILVTAISMCTLVMVLVPSSPDGAAGGSTDKSGATTASIPFRVIDRANYNDPAAMIVNLSLFDTSILFVAGKQVGSSAFLRSITGIDPILRVPFPTGAFWTNLVMEPDQDGLSDPIVAYPYAFKWADSFLQASYPASRRIVDNKSIRDIFQPDITFGTLEAIAKRHVMKFDPLSVTLRYFSSTNGFWETYIVHGSPYITVKYSQVQPILTTLSTFLKFMCPFDSDGNYNDGDDITFAEFEARRLKWGVCTVSSSAESKQKKVLSGVQFLLQTQEDLTWILFASEPISLTFDSERRDSISSVGKFTGVLRIALIPPTPAGPLPSNDTSLLPISESSGLRRLVYHAGLYPIGGSVSWSFHDSASISSSSKKIISGSSSRIGTVQFQFQTALMTSTGSTQLSTNENQLLMLGLPHHADVLSSDSILTIKTFDLEYQCIKGLMSPVVGSTWSYDETLTSTGFDTETLTELHPEVKNIILISLKNDLEIGLPLPSENFYEHVKHLARLAQLAHIASMMTYPRNMNKNQSQILNFYLETLDDAKTKLHSSIRSILDSKFTDKLFYDAKFGGIVSRNGLMDKNDDFGNGRYNDHHFHYGYLLYACAVMGSLNSTFVSVYGSFVDNILFDVAYHGNGDSASVDDIFFPLARHKSWFDGHSFASGLFPLTNGKSQGGSSEAVNCYYGAFLWSSIRNSNSVVESADLTDYARLLLATEIRGAKKYWHMNPPVTTTLNKTLALGPRDDMFSDNYMVGILGMLDSVASPSRGMEQLQLQINNFMPVTAISNELFDKAYVEKVYANAIMPLHSNISSDWMGYIVCEHGIIDPSLAWLEAKELVSAELDSALSKSQVLYWVSSHSEFTYISNDDDTHSRDTAVNAIHVISALCDDNVDCAVIGLTGFCCPTGEGIILGCCNSYRRYPS